MARVESWLDQGVLNALDEEAGYRRVDVYLNPAGCQRHKCEEIQDFARFGNFSRLELKVSSWEPLDQLETLSSSLEQLPNLTVRLTCWFPCTPQQPPNNACQDSNLGAFWSTRPPHQA